jgi:hypothetical protein
MCHAAISLLIASAIWPFMGLPAGLTAGVAFYVGREFTQWEQGGGPGLPFDWLGVLAPAAVCLLVYLVTLFA